MSLRFAAPFKYPSFVFYFVLVIMIVGTIGFIAEIIDGLKYGNWVIEELTTNASNVTIALIAASSVELILIHQDDLIEPARKSDVQITGLSFLILGFLLWILANYFKDCWVGLLVSILALILAYYFWWIANAGNNTLTSDDNPLAPMGGNAGPIGAGGGTTPTTSGPKLKGSTDNFKTR